MKILTAQDLKCTWKTARGFARYAKRHIGSYHGLCHYDNRASGYARLHKATKTTKTIVDGMCGRGSVSAIMAAIGIDTFTVQ